MIKKIIIVVLIVCIVLFTKHNIEGFQDVSFDAESDVKENEITLLHNSKNRQGDIVKLNEANVDDRSLDSFIMDFISNDRVIMQVKEDESESAESLLNTPVDEEDYDSYNHKLRLINISKQIRQHYLIDLLKSKINYILGTLENVDNLCKIEK